jgi:hypothetical protein
MEKRIRNRARAVRMAGAARMAGAGVPAKARLRNRHFRAG